MLKLGYTLPNLANRCLHQSTGAKFYRFGSRDLDLAKRIREEVVGGLSIVFTRYAKVGETVIRQSNNICKAIGGVDASQLYPYAMCQPMPTGPYVRWDFQDGKFKATKIHRSDIEAKVLGYYR